MKTIVELLRKLNKTVSRKPFSNFLKVLKIFKKYLQFFIHHYFFRMILNQIDNLNWSFICRKKETFDDTDFKTASLLALLQILYPDISPKKGFISRSLFVKNDLFGALHISSNTVVIANLKFRCIQILNKKTIPKKWDILLDNFIGTNCVHFSITGSLTKQERLFQLSLNILFSKNITQEFKVNFFAQRFRQ